MITKPLYEHAQELFLSWTAANPEEISQLLMQLRLSKNSFTLFREQTALTQQVIITQMTASAITLIGTMSNLDTAPAQVGEKVLCVYHGENQSLGFVSHIQAVHHFEIDIAYPQQLWIRNARKYERFGLTVNMTAFWTNPQRDEPIYGQVMDVSYGGFLGGMQMAAFDDSHLSVKRHEKGEVILLKSDQTRWRCEAALRRSALITQGTDAADTVTVPTKGFALLGFSFIFKNAQESEDLAHFLEGIIEPIF